MLSLTLQRMVVLLISISLGWGVYIPSAFAQQSSTLECFSRLWPHEKSALVPDPAVVYGRLDNGFRYAIVENGHPEDRVALNFHIGVGSVHEEDFERGYAHFLEHMLFNGTEHFPPGKLVEYFQSLGMNFGADTNAYTTYDRTVYSIVLPQNSIEELKEGLFVISDWARKALILDEEVERERGVILAEKIARDSVAYRTHVVTQQNALEGTRLAQRQPIGTEETITAATGELLRNFYDKWYRPENMTLVVVGDIEADTVATLIQETFAAMKGAGPVPECPGIGNVAQGGLDSFYYPEKESGDVQVSLESYWNTEWQNDSFTLQVASLKEYIAGRILQKRLERFIEKGSGLLADPQVYASDFFDRIRYSVFSASTTADTWRDSLTVLEKTMREAVAHGVTGAELDVVKNEVRNYFISSAQKAGGRESTGIARQMIWHLSNNRVFQSPLQERNNYVPVLDLITLEDIHSTIERLYGRSSRLVEVTGNLIIEQQSPVEEILEVYQKSRSQPVSKYSGEKQEEFPYLQPSGDISPVEESQVHKHIDGRSYHFANGLVVHLKKTDFKENEVKILLEFGPGKQAETMPGLALMAEEVISRSGTAKMSATAIEDALAGSSLNYSFSIEKTLFRFSASSLKSDAELLIRTLYTLFKDPGFSQEALGNAKLHYEKMYEAMRSDIRGVEELYFKQFFAGGNTLFGMAAWEDLEKLTLADVQDWASPYFRSSIPQISVVGDFDEDEMLHMLSSYFGGLDIGERSRAEDEQISFPTGEELRIEIPSQLDKSLVVLGWETTGFKDIHVVRRLGMLASIFEERIRLRVREELGAAYSPVVYHAANRFIPEYGVIYARIIVDADKVAAVEKAVRDISRDMYTNGVSEEELMRAKNPLLTSLKDMMQNNDYWLYTVFSQSYFNPEQLEWPTTIVEDNTSITAAEMSAYAKEYLKPETVATAVAVPRDDS